MQKIICRLWMLLNSDIRVVTDGRRDRKTDTSNATYLDIILLTKTQSLNVSIHNLPI